MNSTPPDTTEKILIALLILFFALGLSLAIPLYLRLKKKLPDLANQRVIFRKSIKWSFFLASGLVFIFFAKAFNVLNIANLLLFAIFYYAIYLQLRAKK
jgi:hypothetical protein